MLQTAIVQVLNKPLPPFEERYRAAIADDSRDVALASVEEARDALQPALADVGYQVTKNRNLRETFLAWEHERGYIPASEVAEQARAMNAELLKAMRERVFSRLNFGASGYAPYLSDVAFDGHYFNTISGVGFTGSSIYHGGDAKGKPKLKGLFEYNTDHPLTRVGLLHLCAHEVIGHYVNAAVKDVLWRSGKLGFLATAAQMCTPDTVFQEGWAQNMFEIIYGSRDAAAEVFGKDLLVALAHDDLQDIAKHNGAILHQRDGVPIDRVKEYFATECVMPVPLVKKLSGGWSQDPILGPMYGPAYLVGRTVVNDAIRRHGPISVAEVGYHLKGQVDISTFQMKVEKMPVIH